MQPEAILILASHKLNSYPPKSVMNRSSVSFASEESRLVSPCHSQPLSISPGQSFESSLATSPAEVYSTFAPVHYESGYAYPLIVWLHGPESSEGEIQDAMPLVSARNYVAIAPRGTHCSAMAEDRFSWGSVSVDAASAAERVDDCINYAKEFFNIHPERVFLAGRASGGTMALRLAMEYPELCAGAISLGGRMPQGSRPLKRINECRQIPLMLAVSPDESLPLDDVLSDLRLLHYAGFSLALRIYPEGDELTTTMLADMNTWIMDQVCPQSVDSNC